MFPWAVDRQADDVTGLHATILVVGMVILIVTKHSTLQTTPTLEKV